MDLRRRVLAAIDDGMSYRAAVDRLGAAPAKAIRRHAERRETGSFSPKPQGGDIRSRWAEKGRAEIFAIWEGRKNISLGADVPP